MTAYQRREHIALCIIKPRMVS